MSKDQPHPLLEVVIFKEYECTEQGGSERQLRTLGTLQ